MGAFLDRGEKGSLSKYLFSIHAVASAHFERDYERAEKSKEKSCGSDALKGMGKWGKREEMKKIKEKRGNLETLGKVKRSGGGDEENGWQSG